MISVTFKPDRCVPTSKSSHYFDVIELKPGENLLAQDVAIALKAHPDFSRYEEWGAISMASPSLPAIPDAAPKVKPIASIQSELKK